MFANKLQEETNDPAGQMLNVLCFLDQCLLATFMSWSEINDVNLWWVLQNDLIHVIFFHFLTWSAHNGCLHRDFNKHMTQYRKQQQNKSAASCWAHVVGVQIRSTLLMIQASEKVSCEGFVVFLGRGCLNRLCIDGWQNSSSVFTGVDTRWFTSFSYSSKHAVTLWMETRSSWRRSFPSR